VYNEERFVVSIETFALSVCHQERNTRFLASSRRIYKFEKAVQNAKAMFFLEALKHKREYFFV
jgi:hypothetical protein